MNSFQNIVLFLAILAAGAFLSACEHESDFPPEPVINSLSFDTSNYSMVVEFTDGDGDFGIPENDPAYNYYLDEDSTQLNPYYYNLWVDYYEKREGEWVLVTPPSSFSWRVPVLTPAGQNKQLEVKITNDMSFDLPLLTAQSDTIKFRVVLIDRAKNQSNPEETQPLYIPR